LWPISRGVSEKLDIRDICARDDEYASVSVYGGGKYRMQMKG